MQKSFFIIEKNLKIPKLTSSDWVGTRGRNVARHIPLLASSCLVEGGTATLGICLPRARCATVKSHLGHLTHCFDASRQKERKSATWPTLKRWHERAGWKEGAKKLSKMAKKKFSQLLCCLSQSTLLLHPPICIPCSTKANRGFLYKTPKTQVDRFHIGTQVSSCV